MTIDDQIRDIVREETAEVKNSLDGSASVNALLALWAITILGIACLMVCEHLASKRLDRLESRSSEITVIHPDRRLERVVEPWGGAL